MIYLYVKCVTVTKGDKKRASAVKRKLLQHGNEKQTTEKSKHCSSELKQQKIVSHLRIAALRPFHTGSGAVLSNPFFSFLLNFDRDEVWRAFAWPIEMRSDWGGGAYTYTLMWKPWAPGRWSMVFFLPPSLQQRLVVFTSYLTLSSRLNTSAWSDMATKSLDCCLTLMTLVIPAWGARGCRLLTLTWWN